MRPVHPFALLLLTTPTACYDGRENTSFALAPGEPTDAATTDEVTTSGDPGSSDEAGETTAAKPIDPTEPPDLERLTPCELCGCHRWTARTDAPTDLAASLAALPDGGAAVAVVTANALTLHRFAPDGALRWSRVYPGEVANVQAVALGDEIVALAGTVTGSLELAPDQPNLLLTSAGLGDGFLVLLSETGDGAPIWGERFGDATDQRVSDIAVASCEDDLDGCRIHLAGVHDGALGLGPESLAPSATSIFHSRLDALYWQPDAAQTWRLPTDVTADPPTLVASLDGSVTLVATVRDTDPGDLVVRRLRPDEQEQWHHRLGVPGRQRAVAAAHAIDGGLWLAGYVDAATDLGVGPFGKDGGETSFLAALGPDGLPRSTRAIGGWLPARQALATTRTGAVVVTGYANDTLDLGGGPLTFRGGRDVMLARYGPTGEHRCSALYGDVAPQEGVAAASHGDHTFVLARVQGSIDFDHTWLPSVTAEDLMLAAFSR